MKNKKKFLKNTSSAFYKVIRSFILIEICFVVLYPVLYFISMAFRPADQVLDPNVVWLPMSFTLENVKTVWSFIDYPKALLTSLLLDFTSTCLQTAVCCFVGYGFARFPIRFKNFWFAMVILSIVVPPSTTVIATYLQYRSFDFLYVFSFFNWIFTGKFEGINLINSPFVLYLPALFGQGIRSGLFIFMYRQYFATVPKELEEAAYIDGAGTVRCFLKIMVPNAKSTTLAVFLLTLVWYWNDTFFTNTYMTSKHTLSTGLVYLRDQISIINAETVFDPYQVVTILQAGCLMTILPLTILYIVMQRYFTEGLENVGITG